MGYDEIILTKLFYDEIKKKYAELWVRTKLMGYDKNIRHDEMG